MAVGFSVDLRNAENVNIALRNAQRTLRDETVPIMEAAAGRIRDGAQARALQHPTGLWRTGRGRLGAPSYRTRRGGAYLFRVETPGGAVGRAEAMSEFAAEPATPQGASLIYVLTSIYGRSGGSGGGRILWAAADEAAEAVIRDIEGATAKAAEKVEKQMGEA